MLKTLCQFSLRPSVDPDEFWRDYLDQHAQATVAAVGDLLTGYVLNRSQSAISGPVPYAVTAELWFRTEADRTRFLEIAATIDDGFDDDIVDLCAYAVEEVIVKPPLTPPSP
jgi:hypothetical protein